MGDGRGERRDGSVGVSLLWRFLSPLPVMSLKNFVKFWGPVIVWGGIIFYFSTLPGSKFPRVSFGGSVVSATVHIFEYGVLYFLVFRAVNSLTVKRTSNWFLPFVFCLVYAVSDEFHQKFTPGRKATIQDVGFDFSGMLLSSMLLLLSKF